MNRPAQEPIDRLSALLERFRVRARLFHAGRLCGIQQFDMQAGRGFLHVLRQGTMAVEHPGDPALPRRLELSEPTLLFYPRPALHYFLNPPEDGSDFTCATLEFEGGAMNPLARALPPLIALPLASVEGLSPALALLFAETERVRCGQRLLADRLFEVVLIQLLRWLIDHPSEAGVQKGLLTGLADLRLARALIAVHAQPGAPWTLVSMAEKANMSRSAFANAFRDAVGQTPGDYLADWRLSLAQAGLRKGEPIKALADQLGYANPSALSRAFAARVGLSPREWLRGDAGAMSEPPLSGDAMTASVPASISASGRSR